MKKVLVTKRFAVALLAALLLGIFMPVQPAPAVDVTQTNIMLSAFQKNTPAPAADPIKGKSLNIWRTMGALLLVVGVLIAANRLLQRRLSGTSYNPGTRRMRVVERLALDNRRYVVLVAVDQREIAMAVSANQIMPLGMWPKPDAAADAGAAEPVTFPDLKHLLLPEEKK